MSVFFVSGGTGFIGSWLVKELSRRGHSVHALVRDRAKAKSIAFPNVDLYQGDVTDVASLLEAMKGCDAAFHAAAYAKVWSKDPTVFDKVNVGGTQNVMEAALQVGLQKMVITSSAGILGPSNHGIVTETYERNVPYFNPYERTKAEASGLAMKYSNKLDVVAVLPTRVFGPYLYGEPESVTSLIKRYVLGNWRIIPGSGKQLGNYCFIEDVVAGHLLAMEKGVSSQSYLLGGANLSYDEFFAKIAELSNIYRRMVHMPTSVIQAATYLQSLGTLAGIPPLLTPDWMAKVRYDWEVSDAKAQLELGWQKTPIDEALVATITHFVA